MALILWVTMTIAVAWLGSPCTASAQSPHATDTQRIAPSQFIVAAGFNPISLLVEDPGVPIASLLASEKVDGQTIGASISWIPDTGTDWVNENFATATLRYYSTKDTGARRDYGFVGLGCIARFRSGRLPSSGQNISKDGIPGTHDITFRPCAEFGFGGAIPLTPASLFEGTLGYNINVFHSYLFEQISVGTTW